MLTHVHIGFFSVLHARLDAYACRVLAWMRLNACASACCYPRGRLNMHVCWRAQLNARARCMAHACALGLFRLRMLGSWTCARSSLWGAHAPMGVRGVSSWRHTQRAVAEAVGDASSMPAQLRAVHVGSLTCNTCPWATVHPTLTPHNCCLVWFLSSFYHMIWFSHVSFTGICSLHC
jgi:hypothetical protein